MLFVAQTQDIVGWDYRMWLWIGSMLLALLILFLAAVAVFVGRSRTEHPES